ncbi:hypothetical protein BDZ88DRAFT_426364 [Geranomyces variabilis]|nr:hypothetical protein BDZ88DRAFT_426364 [Geranomyces variabilis]
MSCSPCTPLSIHPAALFLLTLPYPPSNAAPTSFHWSSLSTQPSQFENCLSGAGPPLKSVDHDMPKNQRHQGPVNRLWLLNCPF